MSLTIRPYQDKDRESLLSCIEHLQAWESSLEPEIKASGEDVAHSFLLHFIEEDANCEGKLLVAELDGRVVGFVNGYIEEDRDAKDLVIRRWFYLSDIAVLPEYKGQNIGGQLIVEIEKYALSRGLSQIQIGLLAKNGSAKNFYMKHGYRDYEHVVLKTIN